MMALRDDLTLAKSRIDTLEDCIRLDIYGALREVDPEAEDRFAAMQDALRAQLPGARDRLSTYFVPAQGRRSHRKVMALFKAAIDAALNPQTSP
jgi:hypothetical protein